MRQLIKISKVAKDLGVTTQTLYNWWRAGKLTFIKSITGRNFIDEETYKSLISGTKNKYNKNELS